MLRDNVQPNPLAGICAPLGRALIVDQNPKDLQAYAAVLRCMGFEVTALANYHEAGRCLEEKIPDFIFVSQGSSAFESRGVVERAVARNRRTPVVVVTDCLDMGCYLEAMQLGAVDYVEKPLGTGEVEHLVTTYLQPRVVECGHRA